MFEEGFFRLTPAAEALLLEKDARRALVAHGLRLVAKLSNETLWESTHNVDTYLVLLERQDNQSKPIAMIDMGDTLDLPPPEAFTTWLEGKQYPNLNAQAVFVSADALGGDIRLDPAYHDPAYLELRPPQGYGEHHLGDIADIIAGVRIDPSDRLTEQPVGEGTPYVQVRHLRADGTLDDRPYWLRPELVEPHASKRAMPSDILVSVAGTIGKVGFVAPAYRDGVLFDTSIRRVRIKKGSSVAEVGARRWTEGLR